MNFANLVQQAQQMQKKVAKAKKEFDEKEFDIITGKIKGNLEITELHIEQSMMSIEHQEDVQDLLMITLNQMIKKINNEREDTVNKVTNGVDVSAFL